MFTTKDAKHLVINSRMDKAFKGFTHGYSCNFFIVENDVWSISESQAWTNLVLKHGGAPSLDLSKLYPAGTPVRNGGVSSGVVPFAIALDGCMGSWFKPGKNSAGLIGIDITHPDLGEFLDTPFKKASKVVYFTKGEEIPAKALSLFIEAYNSQSNLFAYKRESREWGTNLCTEIQMKHKHTCVLGTINLAKYETIEDFRHSFKDDLLQAAIELIKLDRSIERMNRGDRAYDFVVTYDKSNKHVGLSVIGLATLLSNLGITYPEFLGNHTLWATLMDAYDIAAQHIKEVYPEYLRVFTQAPTVNSHTYVTTSDGLAVSAELSPVTGLRTTVLDAVTKKPVERVLQLVISKEKGNRVLHHPATVATKYDVSWEAHYHLFTRWQRMLNATGLAQNISYETYRIEGDNFDMDDFDLWYHSDLNSLYYLRKLSEISDFQNDLKFDNPVMSITDDMSKLFAECSLEQSDTDCGCAG